jgi:cytochrome c553
MLLLSAPLIPGRSRARAKLERELAAYSTPADRRDLEATLDQYSDDTTRELREILASQAPAARTAAGFRPSSDA